MKNILLSLLLVGASLGGILPVAAAGEGNKGTTKNQMTIKIGEKTFTATLEDNATATAFKATLPLTLKMGDVNSNEKAGRLSAKLPTKDSNPGRIQTGDLMIWTSQTLVLFYQSFPTSYSYTKVGRIDDASGLAAAVGAGNVTATFELK